MKAIIAALALVGLFTTQAHAAKSCGQMIEEKAEANARIAYLVSKINSSNDGEKIAFWKSEVATLKATADYWTATINDLCKGDDYND
ncbi:hypothetical protein [Bdellovibrio sp. HCB209]|uniref:hypothetical protein n=1 Tax=Bdellovibrio sp. HCB209 TaxID=3394354 RepID=UPI0039B6DEBE